MGSHTEQTEQGKPFSAFVALSTPATLRQAVEALPRDEHGRWTHTADLHITLRYLGFISAEQCEAVQNALSHIRRAPFHIEVNGLSLFNKRQQQILFADVQSTRKITTLVTDMTDKLQKLGFDFGTRPYVPHITLARFKNNARLEPYIARHTRSLHTSWRAQDFHLMRSAEPDDSGKRYDILQSYRLQ